MTRRRNSPSSASGETLPPPATPAALESMPDERGDLGFFCCCGWEIAVDPSRRRTRTAAPIGPFFMGCLQEPGYGSWLTPDYSTTVDAGSARFLTKRPDPGV